ncbi:UNVERIFIED_CONTAM: Phytochrome C [Sesamum calycinum]|uniref:Phytochrome C n=1 Tax=Sesamum calycinum TaxID=2727403 RepID=A0AAW2J0T0_9LAMI
MMSSKSTTNKTGCSRSSSARSRQGARIAAQTPIDAKLHVDFERSEQQFDYSSSVNASNAVSDVPSSTVSSYLQKMQRGSLVQPFGCLIAIHEQDFRCAALHKAANFGEVNMLNPILLHSKTSGKPFYAILHRIDVGLVIDLEPVNPSDVPVTAAGALKSYKLAAKAISRLQSLSSGNISLLCDVLVREVKDLTGYDRIMVYKFHDDDHGEVIAECRRPDLEPYLGLHYPATDIPQASRFLFMKNRVRMICDCLARPVKVFGVQINKEVELAAQLKERHILRTQTVLCDMLLRDAPMGIVTQSPNVMDLVRCDGAALYYRKKCWLLGVTPTEAQIKDIAEWLLEFHGSSTGLSTDSLMEAGYPDSSVLGDAVCGMAAVKITSSDFLFWFRSHTAKEVKWGGAKHDPHDKDDGSKMHPRSSFKAFLEVVKRRSLPWEDVEMDAIHSLQLILRGSLQDKVADESKMIVSVPAVDTSIQRPFHDLVVDDAADRLDHVLTLALKGKEEKNVEIKLKTFGAQEKNGPVILVANACCSRDVKENIVGICFVGQDVTAERMILDKYNRVQGDYFGIMRNPCPLIPPIFVMDEHGRCVEWNDAMQKLSGLKREQAIEQMLLGEVFTVHSFGCQVKDQDTLTKLRILLNTIIAGQNADKVVFGFFDREHKYVEALVSANRRTDSQGRITGVLCFLHVASPELQHAMEVQKVTEQAAANTLTKLAYIRTEMRNPLSGIKCLQNMMKSSDLSKEQRQLLRTSELCGDQLAKIIDDTDIEGIEESYREMKSDEFNLGEALEVVMNQVMILSRERQVRIIYDLPSEVLSMFLYGDILRLQQVLSDFLATALLFTPASEGSSIIFKIITRKESIGTKMHVLHVEFRITHPAPGIPEELIREMFYYNHNVSREGLGLYISQKLVKIMNGTVQYLREAEKASFIILLEFPFADKS